MRVELSTGTPAEVAGDSAERGLVIVPDIMGLRPLFDEMVARLARQWRCRVVAPDLYPGQSHLDLDGRFAAASALDDAAIVGDMLAAADVTGAETVGCIGFCMGGMYVLKATPTGRFHRLVPFYGMIRVPERWRGPGQGEPLDALGAGHAERVLAVIGTVDPYTPPDDVAALEATGASVVAYEGAEHGFVHDPDRPAHRPDDASDAWSRAGDWLWS